MVLKRFFGPRWSILFVYGDTDIQYELSGASPNKLIGYVNAYFKSGGVPLSPWALALTFNRKDVSFDLTQDHFGDDGSTTEIFTALVKAFDPDCVGGNKKPVFIDKRTNSTLSISGINSGSESKTLFTVLDQIFYEKKPAPRSKPVLREKVQLDQTPVNENKAVSALVSMFEADIKNIKRTLSRHSRQQLQLSIKRDWAEVQRLKRLRGECRDKEIRGYVNAKTKERQKAVSNGCPPYGLEWSIAAIGESWGHALMSPDPSVVGKVEKLIEDIELL